MVELAKQSCYEVPNQLQVLSWCFEQGHAVMFTCCEHHRVQWPGRDVTFSGHAGPLNMIITFSSHIRAFLKPSPCPQTWSWCPVPTSRTLMFSWRMGLHNLILALGKALSLPRGWEGHGMATRDLPSEWKSLAFSSCAFQGTFWRPLTLPGATGEHLQLCPGAQLRLSLPYLSWSPAPGLKLHVLC